MSRRSRRSKDGRLTSTVPRQARKQHLAEQQMIQQYSARACRIPKLRLRAEASVRRTRTWTKKSDAGIGPESRMSRSHRRPARQAIGHPVDHSECCFIGIAAIGPSGGQRRNVLICRRRASGLLRVTGLALYKDSKRPTPVRQLSSNRSVSQIQILQTGVPVSSRWRPYLIGHDRSSICARLMTAFRSGAAFCIMPRLERSNP
jgi:hypothetical protein